MPDKPDVGFGFGVEGDQSLLAVIRQLRQELKNVKEQQESTASAAQLLSKAWTGLIQVAGALKLAEFARDVFNTAVQLGKLSQITGVSTETLSVYYKAATDVGVAHEAVDKGLGQLVRSFVLLQAGNSKAAQGFRLLHLSAKDFVGLSTDEKVKKVSAAFAAMKDGPEKAAAATALFSKAGRELIPVLDQLGTQGFAEVQAQAERLGLIFSKEMAEGALRAKAALADLEGVAEGAAAQFETGLLPALADAADGVVAFALETDKANKDGENSFKQLGEAVGWAIKAIVLVLTAAGTTLKDFFLIVGLGLETIGREIINEIKTVAGVALALSNGDFKTAWENIKNGGVEAAAGVKDAWNAALGSIKDSDARFMAEFDKMFANDTPRKLPKAGNLPAGDVRGAELDRGGLDRAEESALKQKAQDEMTLYRDLAKQKAEQDKRDYDQGLISLEEYFSRRRVAIQEQFTGEVDSLSAEWARLQDLLSKAEGRGGKTPQQELANQRAILKLKQEIAHVESQAEDVEIKRETALATADDERDRAKQEHLLKELEAQKKLSDLEGNRAKSAQLAQQIEDLQLRRELEQLGRTKAEIDTFLAQYGAARGIRVTGAEAQQGFDAGEASLANKKASLEEQVADNQLMSYQAERQLRAEYQKEIPILQAKVDLLRQQALAAQAAAQSRGETGPNALAIDLTKQADQDEAKLIKLRTEVTKMDASWMSWRTSALHSMREVSTQVTTGFNSWIQGQESFTAAAKHLWNNFVMDGINGLERLAASFLEHHLRMLLMKQITDRGQLVSETTTAAAGDQIKRQYGIKSVLMAAKQAAVHAFKSVFETVPFPFNLVLAPVAAAGAFTGALALGAFAEGGFIHGPGTATSDSILARVSRGEYVVKAAAVERVGVGFLDQVNRGYADGGVIGGATASTSTAVGSTSGDPNLAALGKTVNKDRLRVEIAHVDAKAAAQQTLWGGIFGGLFGALFPGLAEGG
jgi:hypothetical protein